jgi:hypothetical protein
MPQHHGTYQVSDQFGRRLQLQALTWEVCIIHKQLQRRSVPSWQECGDRHRQLTVAKTASPMGAMLAAENEHEKLKERTSSTSSRGSGRSK